MSRLPVLKPREVIRALERAGFQVDRIRGSHYFFKHPAKPKLFVTVPYHGKDIRPGTLAAIIEQAGMTADEFVALL